MMMNRGALFAASLAVLANRMAAGTIVINEIMRNPANVFSERNGEWVELFNPTEREVDINGWTIKDDGTNSHVISNGGPLLVAPGGYLVIGNNKDFATNGGVVLDYEYDTNRIQLNNKADEFVLLDGAVEVDRVNWDSGILFPNQDGAAMALRDPTLDNNVGSNWCNAETLFGTGDRGTPGAANDCPPPGLVINEIMRNPANVETERRGEWFELYNPTDTAYDINGWTIKDDGTNQDVISNGGPLIIPPGEYLVLGNNDDVTTNGGVILDYEYNTKLIQLSNSDDELVLLAGSVEVDRVEWDGGVSFPNTDGAAMALLDPALENNVGSNWCHATTVFGNGDTGTPGASNDCPVPTLVINEIMRNPKNIFTEREGEWFELYNPTNRSVDIDGWTIKDEGTNSYMIDNGGPLVIPQWGYLVLGNNADVSTNGGVVLNYEYDTTLIQLNNEPDELVLLAGSVEIDRVEWDGGSNGIFPNTDGAAMALIDPTLDNNVVSNWCEASTVYGAGDKGTPGVANDCPKNRRVTSKKAKGSIRGFP